MIRSANFNLSLLRRRLTLLKTSAPPDLTCSSNKKKIITQARLMIHFKIKNRDLHILGFTLLTNFFKALPSLIKKAHSRFPTVQD